MFLLATALSVAELKNLAFFDHFEGKEEQL